MNTRKITLALLCLSLLGFCFGWALGNSTELGFCLVTEPTCINKLTWIGNALYYGSAALTLIFLILLFTPQAFPAWKKFAIWFVPLAALLFAFYPGPGANDLFSPYPEQIFRWVSVLYVIISLLIIASTFRKGAHQ